MARRQNRYSPRQRMRTTTHRHPQAAPFPADDGLSTTATRNQVRWRSIPAAEYASDQSQPGLQPASVTLKGGRKGQSNCRPCPGRGWSTVRHMPSSRRGPDAGANIRLANGPQGKLRTQRAIQLPCFFPAFELIGGARQEEAGVRRPFLCRIIALYRCSFIRPAT